MTSKEAIKLAYKEFQKDFEEGEENNQWLKNVIEGLKQAERELKVFNDLKPYLYISGKQTGSGFPNLAICVKKPNTENVYIPFYETKTYEDFILYQEVFKENDR